MTELDELAAGARVLLAVRADDLDPNGHVRGPAYLAYADHARWLALDAAGIDVADLLARGIGPVNLETTLRFHRELRALDQVEVHTRFEWTSGKVSRVLQRLVRSDGTLVAQVSSVSGLLDLTERKLLPRPDQYWRSLATDPAVLGLT
ncbi:MAG TPA: acyl-CoA thioesterase [Pseudonocardia sp.]|nr:acyl-CoA thioesterase [Pseudonocardia sp.]